MSPPDALLHRYLTHGRLRVEGWMSPHAATLLLGIDAAQRAAGVSGNVGEIGVHHGKLFIPLYLLARGSKGETALAVDLFEDQERNVDRSGAGDRARLLSNLAQHAGGTERLKLLAGDSTQLGAAELTAAAGGPFRLFSVDGSHEAAAAEHDLRSAAGALVDGGVIILDDYFNEMWPGVSEGTARYFLGGERPPVAPVAIGGNKVFLATRAHVARYRDALANTPGATVVERKLYGDPVLCFDFAPRPWRRRLTDTALWQAVRDTPVGRTIRRAARRV